MSNFTKQTIVYTADNEAVTVSTISMEMVGEFFNPNGYAYETAVFPRDGFSVYHTERYWLEEDAKVSHENIVDSIADGTMVFNGTTWADLAK